MNVKNTIHTYCIQKSIENFNNLIRCERTDNQYERGCDLADMTCTIYNKKLRLGLCVCINEQNTRLPLLFRNVSETSLISPGRTERAITINIIITIRLPCVLGVMSILTLD